ncbi:D-amino-acid transaminase [Bacillus sp. 1NLA3E]|uniref:D-amino-acid transaminase n=1 Tax=Bacillus sp. 1NLA3E TaxID=666686 RepID=UPI000247E594|nr:D-amino-acid transaminase [Bacillus sp. 1NLA3E]AGK55251.1 D-amino acid aminotransferase [Bacillus sp. 1NLA3E]
MKYAILNGEFVERSQAKVDIEDRGYQFGDGIYEVIRVYNGTMFAEQDHLLRLVECAKKINLVLSLSIAEMKKQLQTLIVKNELGFGIVYLQFTRGVAPRNHAFPVPSTIGSFVAYTKELERPLTSINSGIKAALVDDIRWFHCDIKSLNLLGNLLAKQQAVEAGCGEAILHRDKTITEGSSSNISIIKNGVLRTHQADRYILNGITRQQMLAICRKNEITVEEKAFTVEELLSADEVFISSTTAEITPVVEISGTKIGNGVPGSITTKLQHLLEAEIKLQCGPIQ